CERQRYGSGWLAITDPNSLDVW
nr:immunoglobulin heavy chain junction region [Macaca mulatta]MOW24953.1 immunoglobulin heavy chain junction region [Macaca mulatta]MOW25273.1 immunoglobulin heavy chain junction region [Macaca mulatta]MOW25464.1 immunoglobulin heavy chain junction region [Macaca mulatta]MOW25568.1 immunoglobulin heavy chain junction region [Macaca mulatta]